MATDLVALRHAEAAYDVMPDAVRRALKRGHYPIPRASLQHDLAQARNDCAYCWRFAKRIVADIRNTRAEIAMALPEQRTVWRRVLANERAHFSRVMEDWADARAKRDRFADLLCRGPAA
jgi:hypothetical protein